MNTKNTIDRFACVDEVVATVVNLGLAKPPFITDTDNSSGKEHLHNCMAWWLASTKTHAQVKEFLNDQRLVIQESLQNPIDRCYAWIWLLTLSPQHIRERLDCMKQEDAGQFRHYLNRYRDKAKEARKENSNA